MVKSSPSEGRWTSEEHKRFLEAVRVHGKNWQLVADFVVTRTAVQCRSHAQKLLGRQPPEVDACVLAEQPFTAETCGPYHACSQASQYGESVELCSVLEEDQWSSLSPALRSELPYDSDFFQEPLPHSTYLVSSTTFTYVQTLLPREVRTVALQYVKSQQRIPSREEWAMRSVWLRRTQRKKDNNSE